MSQNKHKQPVIASLLDRLIDYQPEQKRDTLKSRHQILSDLCMSVKRDLENLLNTRRRYLTWPESWQELNKSLVDYGIDDVMKGQLSSKANQEVFCRQLQQIICRYESRFKQLTVKLSNETTNDFRTLAICIEGVLYAEPVPEPVVFDSLLEVETQTFSITRSHINE